MKGKGRKTDCRESWNFVKGWNNEPSEIAVYEKKQVQEPGKVAEETTDCGDSCKFVKGRNYEPLNHQRQLAV